MILRDSMLSFLMFKLKIEVIDTRFRVDAIPVEPIHQEPRMDDLMSE